MTELSRSARQWLWEPCDVCSCFVKCQEKLSFISVLVIFLSFFFFHSFLFVCCVSVTVFSLSWSSTQPCTCQTSALSVRTRFSILSFFSWPSVTDLSFKTFSSGVPLLLLFPLPSRFILAHTVLETRKSPSFLYLMFLGFSVTLDGSLVFRFIGFRKYNSSDTKYKCSFLSLGVSINLIMIF